jgi:hypothetical protein
VRRTLALALLLGLLLPAGLPALGQVPAPAPAPVVTPAGWLRVRVVGPAGQSLAVAVERLADGQWYDPTAKAFTAPLPRGSTPLAPMTPSGPWAGLYRGAIPSGTWPDGAYAVYVLDAGSGAVLQGPLPATIRAGDDAP